METLCTIIATRPDIDPSYVAHCIPLKDALRIADDLDKMRTESGANRYATVRVYAETNNGATLTLIYQPTP